MSRSDALVGAALACLSAASPLSGTGQPEQWTLELTVTIGSVFDAETGLTAVGGVIVEGDRLFVAQPYEQRLRVFSLTGDFLGFIGRDGEGPGEFRSVDGIGLHEGLVWVLAGVDRVPGLPASGKKRGGEAHPPGLVGDPMTSHSKGEVP